MRRAIAILAFVGLLAGPISAWSAAGCCGDADCCKSGICPMHAQHAKAEEADVPKHCHHADAAPDDGSKCHASAQCRGNAKQIHPAPLPRGVLTAREMIPMPAETRAEMWASREIPGTGFVHVPFQPPRLTE